MSFLTKIAGTLSSLFQLGKAGPKLKNNGGVIEARNAADAAYVIARALDPVGNDDLVTKRYFVANSGGPSGGNTVLVDKINGNDGTGARNGGSFLTIQAAINAAVAGDVVIVRPGTYNEVVTCKDLVSLVGLDRDRCIIDSTGFNSASMVTMAFQMTFAHFTVSVVSNNTNGVLFSSTVNNSSTAFDVIVTVTTSTGGCFRDISTGVETTHVMMDHCLGDYTAASNGNGYIKIGAGTSILRDCVFSIVPPNGQAIYCNNGTLRLHDCRVLGSASALAMAGGTISVSAGTVIESFIRVAGSLVTDLYTFPRNSYGNAAGPTVSDDLNSGFGAGSIWVTTVGLLYSCIASLPNGSANWVQVGAATYTDPSKIIPSGTTTIAANASRVIASRLEIASGGHLEIGSGATLEIT